MRTPRYFTCPALSDHKTAAQLPLRDQWMSKKSPQVSILAEHECRNKGTLTQHEICSQHSAKQAKETLITHEPTDRPWEKVAVDICNLDNKDCLITVDYLSNFWEIDRLRDTKASTCV